MRLTLLVVLLLFTTTLAYNTYTCNSKSCHSAPIKIRNCYKPMCYKCGINEVFNTQTLYCDCESGYVPINGYCGKCRQGYQYDPVLMQCVGINPCAINQHIVDGVCKCLPGLITIQNVCQRCPVNQTYFPEYDECRCSVGYTKVNGSCIYIPCEQNEVYSKDDQACVCSFGYYRVNGTCQRCGMNEVYNAATQTCDIFIPPVCGLHEYWFEICCWCEIGFVRIGGRCVVCPENSYYDWNTDSCVCKPGYYFVGEQVRLIPYQTHDTGSSFTTNPGFTYTYKGPYGSVPVNQPISITGSSYDHNGVNHNGPNYQNVATVVRFNS